MLNVFVTRPLLLDSQVWEEGYVRGFAAELCASTPATYHVVERVEDADLVLLLESNKHKTPKSIPRYLQESVLTGFCSNVCSVNYEDTPAGILRGLYTSLEGNRFDEAIHKSWPALYLPNERVYDADEPLIQNTRPNYLFSFVGSVSHPLRRRLIGRYAVPNPRYKVLESKSWYNHSREENMNYIDAILASNFALCPRGHSCYTHRIPEVMALGRVPVVIADGWIPFSIPEKDYFIRVPEKALDDLETILKTRRPEAEALGRRAREIWLKYFAKATRAQATTNAARELVARAAEPLTLAAYRRRWRSSHFKRANQMQLWQRAWQRYKSFARGG